MIDINLEIKDSIINRIYDQCKRKCIFDKIKEKFKIKNELSPKLFISYFFLYNEIMEKDYVTNKIIEIIKECPEQKFKIHIIDPFYQSDIFIFDTFGKKFKRDCNFSLCEAFGHDSSISKSFYKLFNKIFKENIYYKLRNDKYISSTKNNYQQINEIKNFYKQIKEEYENNNLYLKLI